MNMRLEQVPSLNRSKTWLSVCLVLALSGCTPDNEFLLEETNPEAGSSLPSIQLPERFKLEEFAAAFLQSDSVSFSDISPRFRLVLDDSGKLQRVEIERQFSEDSLAPNDQIKISKQPKKIKNNIEKQLLAQDPSGDIVSTRDIYQSVLIIREWVWRFVEFILNIDISDSQKILDKQMVN